MKKVLKKILSNFGYVLLSKDNYKKLAERKFLTKTDINSKNSLLNNFFLKLKSLNYYPEVIYDIGANKGSWSKECLKYFPDSKIYLFEPQTQLKDDIQKVIQDFKNCEIVTVGVGDMDGEMNFTIHNTRDDSCTFMFSEEEARILGHSQVKVPIVRLDSFIKENQAKPPNLLKIDAEGLDIKVLSGMGEYLNDVDIILVEVAIMNHRMDNTALKMLSYLDEHNFKLFEVTDINRPFKNQVWWLSEFAFIKKKGPIDTFYLNNSK